MQKVIVSTSIQAPTEATEAFAAMKDWTFIMVGDQKTPHNLYQNRKDIVYLHPDEQEKMDKELSDLIGWGCIQRRNLGFLYAWKEMGADVIKSCDDDNEALEGWGDTSFLEMEKDVSLYEYEENCIAGDPIAIAGTHIGKTGSLTHRGFPIQCQFERMKFVKTQSIKQKFDIDASFWNGEADVNAWERATRNTYGTFEDTSFPFTVNKLCPFNSQNTLISKTMAPYYYMHTGVQRADDILASYYVQAMGGKVVFTKPTVIQERNPQDITRNLRDEFWMYENCHSFIKDLMSSENKLSVLEKWLPKKSYAGYLKFMSYFN